MLSLNRWLEQKFITGQQQLLFPGMKAPHEQPALPEGGASHETGPSAAGNRLSAKTAHHAADALKEMVEFGDAPSCSFCGSLMTRNGSCFRCQSCGSTSGCS